MYVVNCLDTQLWNTELQLTLPEHVGYSTDNPLRQTGNKIQWN